MLLPTVSKLIRHSQKQPKNVACSLNEQIWNLALFLLHNSIGMLLLMPSFLGHKSQISVSLLISSTLEQYCGHRGTACVELGLLCLFITAWGAETCGRESCKGTVWPDQSWLLVCSDHHQQCKWETPLGFPYGSGSAAEAKLAESQGHPNIHPMHFLFLAWLLFQQKLLNP